MIIFLNHFISILSFTLLGLGIGISFFALFYYFSFGRKTEFLAFFMLTLSISITILSLILHFYQTLLNIEKYQIILNKILHCGMNLTIITGIYFNTTIIKTKLPKIILLLIIILTIFFAAFFIQTNIFDNTSITFNFQNIIYWLFIVFFVSGLLYIIINSRIVDKNKTHKFFKSMIFIVPFWAISATLDILQGANIISRFFNFSAVAYIFWNIFILRDLIFFLKTSLFNSINNKINLKENHKAKEYNLTKRETEIIELIFEGYKYKEISQNLFISPLTVKTHIQNIFNKLNVNSKDEIKKSLFY